jgi:glycosyltransferase involved in cell wall biosynthesis
MDSINSDNDNGFVSNLKSKINSTFNTLCYNNGFDADFYLSFYPDLKKAGIDETTAYYHYTTYGKKENRVGSRSILKERIKHIADNIRHDSFQLENIHDVRHDPLNNEPLITILVRTSNRPNLFKVCIDSIFSQKYSNFRVVICYDDDGSVNYLSKHHTNPKCTVFKVNKSTALIDSDQSGYFYNLYCNELLNTVTDGYIIYLDDDDKLTSPYALYAVQQAIEHSPVNSLYVWKFARPDMIIFPSNFKHISVGEISSSNFCVHHSFPKHRNVMWKAQKNADHDFFTRILYFPTSNPPNIVVIPYILAKTQKDDRIGHNGKHTTSSVIPTSETIPPLLPYSASTLELRLKTNSDLDNVEMKCPIIPPTPLKEPTISTFYMVFPRFDWYFYVTMYIDLQQSNITTELLAMKHYLSFGRDEKRRTHEVISYNETGIRTFPYPNNSSAPCIPIEYILTSDFYIWISPALHHLREQIIKKYKWNVLTDHTIQEEYGNKKIIFFGVYTDEDIYAIMSYSHLPRYIIWGGNDANIDDLHSYQTITEISRLKSCVHICISKCLYHRLVWLFPNARCLYVSFNLVDKELFSRYPQELSDSNSCIYIYIYNGRLPGREEIYGKHVYEEVIKKLAIVRPNINFRYIYSSVDIFPHNEMPEIYKKCCIMLRLTKQDGNANSVQECESMNIPVVHNLSDYGLKWNTSDDVVKHICNCKGLSCYNPLIK